MKDYANTMRSLCIVHSGASVSIIYAWMIDGWGVYVGAVSIEAMTVPILPSVPRPFTYAYDTGTGLCPCVCVFYICYLLRLTSKQINNKQTIK